MNAEYVNDSWHRTVCLPACLKYNGLKWFLEEHFCTFLFKRNISIAISHIILTYILCVLNIWWIIQLWTEIWMLLQTWTHPIMYSTLGFCSTVLLVLSKMMNKPQLKYHTENHSCHFKVGTYLHTTACGNLGPIYLCTRCSKFKKKRTDTFLMP
jgi:hypothetical protein